MRIRWSGYDNQHPDLVLTVADQSGNVILRLFGGNNTPSFGLPTPKVVRFSAGTSFWEPMFVSDVRTTGVAKKGAAGGRVEQKVRFIATQESGVTEELYVRRNRDSWASVHRGGMLPALSLKVGGGFVRAFKAQTVEHQVLVQQPDQTVDLGRRVPSQFDTLVATIATRAARPLQADGTEDLYGDMVYTLKNEPTLLRSVQSSERDRSLLLAMCSDPFWSWGDRCVGYLPNRPGLGG